MSLSALTLHRPWAWLIANGHKPVENRGWKPPGFMLGRHLAIHAGKTWDQEASETVEEHLGVFVPPEREHVAGAIVAVVRVCAIIMRTGPALRSFEVVEGNLPERFDPRWFGADFGWVLDDVTAIEPVAVRGAQGLWPVRDPVLATVRERWRAARAEAQASQ